MNISDQFIDITGATVGVLAVVAIILLDLHVRRHGSLFSGTPSPTMRILAGILGLIFAALFFYKSDVTWIVAAFFLFAYALGYTKLLRRIQGGPRSSANPLPASPNQNSKYSAQEQNQKRSMGAYLLNWLLFILALCAVVYATIWLAWHPANSDPILVAGIIIVCLGGWLYSIFATVASFINLARWLSDKD